MYAFAPDLNPIFEDETLLPVQHADLHRGDRQKGEHRLLYAVLEDAVRCWQVYAGSTRPRGQRLFKEAADWFASDDDASPFTFVAICQLFELDPDYIRGGLRRWSDRNRDVKGKLVPFRVRRVSGTRHMVTARAPGLAHGSGGGHPARPTSRTAEASVTAASRATRRRDGARRRDVPRAAPARARRRPA